MDIRSCIKKNILQGQYSILFIIGLFLFSIGSSAFAKTPDKIKLSGDATAHAKYVLSAQEAMARLRDDPLVILVDVRRKLDFQKIRIPGSINIKLPFIKTKQYLKGMKVILLDSGYDSARLLFRANILNENGFDVSVLAGGMAAWHQHGGKFEGDSFAVRDLHFIPPDSLLSLLKDPATYTFIDISSEQKSGDASLLPRLFHVPVQTEKDIAGLITFIRDLHLNKLSTVVILNTEGKYKKVMSLPEHCDASIFFVVKGLRGFQQARQHHSDMLRSREERLKTVGGCPTCPAANKHTRESKPEQTDGISR